MSVVREVAAAEWVRALEEATAQGFAMLDLITAVDRLDRLEVVAVLTDPMSAERCRVVTSVPAEDPVLDTAAAVLPGSAWHEREAAEMFGIVFAGHPDPRPLILREVPSSGVPPLRKESALPERVARPWPGAPTGDVGRRARRPQLPPGVREEWVGDRAPA